MDFLLLDKNIMITNYSDFKRYVAEDSAFYPKRSFVNIYILQQAKALMSQYLYYLRCCEYVNNCVSGGGKEEISFNLLSLSHASSFVEIRIPVF